MQCAVQENPLNETAWAFLGELSLLAFLFNQATKESPLSEAWKCARTALNINPLSQLGHITMGMVNIFLNNKQAGVDTLEYALSLNPNASGLIGMIGCLMMRAGEYSRGIGLINKSIERNKSYPPYFNLLSVFTISNKKNLLRHISKSKKWACPTWSSILFYGQPS
jgi:tetratricopeptide (TPR) repeat protein